MQRIRNILLILFLLIPTLTFSTDLTNWYFDATGGDNDNDGHSTETAKQTIAHLQTLVNADSLDPGDSILFKCGEVWDDVNLVFDNISGYVSQPIVLSSYGTGAKPILRAIKEVTDFTENSSNIWDITDATLPSRRKVSIGVIGSSPEANNTTYNSSPFIGGIFVDGVHYSVGRYPNTGFNEYSSVNTTFAEGHDGEWCYLTDLQIVDNGQEWSGNQWQGGTLRFSDCGWVMTNAGISWSSTNLFDLTIGAGDWCCSCGNGTVKTSSKYFIVNHLNTLDLNYESYWDYTNTKLYIYFDGADLNTHTIEVNSQDYAIKLDTCKNVIVDGLEIKGGLIASIAALDGDSITIKNCDASYSAHTGLLTVSVTNVTLSNNTLADFPQYGIVTDRNGTALIEYNDIRRIGIESVGLDRERMAEAIISIHTTTNIAIRDNIIDSVSRCGISHAGSHSGATIDFYENVISDYCMYSGDCSGIYSAQDSVNVSKKYRKNIVYKMGEHTATSAGILNGLYLDDGSWHFTVDSNVVYDAAMGLYIHGHNASRHHDINHNLFAKFNRSTFTFGFSGIFCDVPQYPPPNGIHYLNIQNNDIISTDNGTGAALGWNGASGETAPTSTGTIMDNNDFYTPIRTDTLSHYFMAYWGDQVPRTNYTITTWFSTFGYEENSTTNKNSQMWELGCGVDSSDFVKVFMNGSNSSHYFDLGDCAFIDLEGDTIQDSVLVVEHSAKALMYESGTISTIDDEFYYEDIDEEPTRTYIWLNRRMTLWIGGRKQYISR